MSSGNIISQGHFNNIPLADRINTLNLDQSIRAATVLTSPLIKFVLGTALGFEDFNSLLEKDPTGFALQMGTQKGGKSFDFLSNNVLKINEYVRLKRDVLPPAYLEVATGATIIGSASVNTLTVTENASYHGLEGQRLLHVESGEILLVPSDVDNSDTVVPVLRGVDNTTATTTIKAGDRLLVIGQQPDLYGTGIVSPRRIRKRLPESYNGWGYQLTLGMPITAQLTEEGLQYNGQFLQYVDNDMVRNHCTAILNDFLFTDRGTITEEIRQTKDAVGNFNGLKHFASKNPFYASLQNVGTLTPSKFLAATTWFEEFADITGESSNNAMYYFCGSKAFKAFAEYMQAKTLIVSMDKPPTKMGGVTYEWETLTGKVIKFCIDPYLDQIGQGGTVIATATDNVSLYVGKTEFFNPPNPRIQGFKEKSYFMTHIADYIAERHQKLDAMMSYYSLQVGYPELLIFMTGIESASL